MNDVDFSPLRNRLSLKETYQMLHTYSFLWKLGFGVLTLVALTPALVIILFPAALQDSGAVMFLLFLAVAGFTGLYDMYREMNESALTARFAHANNMDFFRDMYPTRYPGSLMREGTYVPYAVRSRQRYFIEFGYLRPMRAQRRSNGTTTYTYVRMKLPKALPTMILKRLSGSALLGYSVSGMESLKLEGEFGDRFDLCVDKGSERDALYIFTPDVMARFLDATKDFDCEIIGDEIYFYSRKRIRFIQPKNLSALLGAFKHVMDKFDSQSGKFKGEVNYGSADNKPFRIPISVLTIVSVVGYTLIIFASIYVRNVYVLGQ